MKRPVSTTVGAVLVVLRVLAGVVWLIALAAQWDQVLEADGGIDPERPRAPRPTGCSPSSSCSVRSCSSSSCSSRSPSTAAATRPG